MDEDRALEGSRLSSVAGIMLGGGILVFALAILVVVIWTVVAVSLEQCEGQFTLQSELPECRRTVAWIQFSLIAVAAGFLSAITGAVTLAIARRRRARKSR